MAMVAARVKARVPAIAPTREMVVPNHVAGVAGAPRALVGATVACAATRPESERVGHAVGARAVANGADTAGALPAQVAAPAMPRGRASGVVVAVGLAVAATGAGEAAAAAKPLRRRTATVARVGAARGAATGHRGPVGP